MAEYEAFINAKNKIEGRAHLSKFLRKAWADGGDSCPGKVYSGSSQDDYVKAHYFDIELAAHAVCNMSGPKPSKAYLETIREALRETENWRWMTQKRNTKETTWVKQILAASGSEKVVVDGHFKSKIERQKQWVESHRGDLGAGFITQVEIILNNVQIEGESSPCSIM